MNQCVWEKYPDAKLLVGRDWTNDLIAGDTITGTPTVEVLGDTTLRCDFAENDGSISKFWLSGGNDNAYGQKVALTIQTALGETLADVIQVKLKQDHKA